ncbi:MAG TPA: phage tail length tape measure family protein [Devosia sp.]|nr:phage tail length tape measure family protein [Devosia sp.]
MTADNSNAVGGIRETRREIEGLARATINSATGQRNVQQEIDRMFKGSHTAWATARDDVASMGQQLDALRAQYNPVFAAEQAHEASLSGIQRAYQLGAISADEMSAAVDREKLTHTSAIAALDGHTGALMRNNRANAQRTNLLFQLQDIGVSLASGMNPLMVAAQQGSQISMIYGAEEGGLGKALSETGKMAGGLATKLWPVALAVGVGAAAIAGMRHEIEETSGKAVSFGDVFTGVFQTFGDWLYSTFKPQIEAIGSWFGAAWDWTINQTKRFINFFANGMADTVKVVGALWNGLPAAIADIGIVMANTIVQAFESAINKSSDLLDGFIKAANKTLGTNLTGPGHVNLPKFANPFAGSKDALGAVLNAPGSNHDYAGDFFGAVQQHAIENYNAGLKETEKAAKSAAQGVKAAKDAFDDFNKEVDFYRSTFGSIFTDINAGLKEGMGLWDALGDAGANALDKIADRALGMAANGIFDMIFGAVMGGLTGSLPGFSYGPGVISDPWAGMRLNAKGAVYNSPSLSAFSGQIVDQPTMFAFARGAGVMGEAGPEAIIPLQRTADGELGVRMTNSPLAGHAFGGGGGYAPAASAPVTFAPVYNFNGSSFNEAQAKRMMADNNRQLMATIPGALADASRRAIRGVS